MNSLDYIDLYGELYVLPSQQMKGGKAYRPLGKRKVLAVNRTVYPRNLNINSHINVLTADNELLAASESLSSTDLNFLPILIGLHDVISYIVYLHVVIVLDNKGLLHYYNTRIKRSVLLESFSDVRALGYCESYYEKYYVPEQIPYFSFYTVGANGNVKITHIAYDSDLIHTYECYSEGDAKQFICFPPRFTYISNSDDKPIDVMLILTRDGILKARIIIHGDDTTERTLKTNIKQFALMVVRQRNQSEARKLYCVDTNGSLIEFNNLFTDGRVSGFIPVNSRNKTITDNVERITQQYYQNTLGIMSIGVGRPSIIIHGELKSVENNHNNSMYSGVSKLDGDHANIINS